MDKNSQEIEAIKGRPMLHWYGKKPLEAIEYFPAQEKEVYGDVNAKDFSKLFWGDNLQVLSHLLKDYRGKIDLIYIDPPFDSKADYVKKVRIRGEKFEGQQQSLLEEKQYTDIWENDEYLQFMYERLSIIRELLSDTGSLFLHADWHRGFHLKLILDEIFGVECFKNEIIWHYRTGNLADKQFQRKHDNIYFYSKSANNKFYSQEQKEYYFCIYGPDFKTSFKGRNHGEDKHGEFRISQVDDVWDISAVFTLSNEHLPYPTQKPEELIERIVNSTTDRGDLVMDCFCGSGTTLAVAQRLGRKWIGCDINIGAIQTTTKRLNQIIQEQKKNNEKGFKGNHAFKVLNVNEYDMFKNELEAKEIIMDMYGVEPMKRSYFDGTLDNKYVKVMPLNRVLNKLDIAEVIKNIEKSIDTFTPKSSSKADEETYEESVLVIGSGIESDVIDFIKKENKTHVKIEVRDIQSDKKNLIFKKPPEAELEVNVTGNKLTVEIKDFHSPLLIKKLQLENEKRLKQGSEAKVEDFRQIIDSVSIDVDYNGTLFNAEIMDLPDKKSVIEARYEYTYDKKGKQTVAIKIIDVLGEEYFETFKVEVK